MPYGLISTRLTAGYVALAFCAMLVLPLAARAEDEAHPACISSIRIDHTEVVDDSNILFYMRDRHIYRTTLVDRCVGLRNDPRGFTYSPTDNNDALCAKFMTIRLNSFSSICMLGPWVRVK